MRLPQQKTYKRMNPWCNCEKQEYQEYHSISDLQHKHDQCACWSITKSGKVFLGPILNILILYLPFGSPWVDLEFNLNPNSILYCNSNKGKIKSECKFSRVRDRNKMHIYSFRVKDVKWTMRLFEIFLVIS